MVNTPAQMSQIVKKSATGIHIGANTHTHGQFITAQSFKTIKAIVKAPQKPIPPLLCAFSLLDILFTSEYQLFITHIAPRHFLSGGFIFSIPLHTIFPPLHDAITNFLLVS